jgi:hypothetical protein
MHFDASWFRGATVFFTRGISRQLDGRPQRDPLKKQRSLSANSPQATLVLFDDVDDHARHQMDELVALLRRCRLTF